jgi:phage virion morphogenesis protein
MSNIQLDFKELNAWLQRVAIEASQLERFKQKVAITITETIALGFKAEQDPYNSNWAKHSPYTEAVYAKKGRPAPYKILTDKGILNKSIEYKVNADSIEFGSNISYAPQHQYGNPYKRIPQRAFLPTKEGGLPQAWKDDIERVFKVVFLPKN